jgi:hypothetical protein
MSANERQEIAEAILNELHFRRYNEAIANECNGKEAMALADNWELFKDAQRLFEFHHDVAGRSEQLFCEEHTPKVKYDWQKGNCLVCAKKLDAK